MWLTDDEWLDDDELEDELELELDDEACPLDDACDGDHELALCAAGALHPDPPLDDELALDPDDGDDADELSTAGSSPDDPTGCPKKRGKNGGPMPSIGSSIITT